MEKQKEKLNNFVTSTLFLLNRIINQIWVLNVKIWFSLTEMAQLKKVKLPLHHPRAVNHTKDSHCVLKKCRALIFMNRGAQIFQKTETHFKIICAIRVKLIKFHTEYQQIIGATIKKIELPRRPGSLVLCTPSYEDIFITNRSVVAQSPPWKHIRTYHDYYLTHPSVI